MAERAGLMPDDVEWLEEQLRRIEKKLDLMPCVVHGEALATYTEKLDNHLSEGDRRRSAFSSTGSMIIQAIMAVAAIGALVIAIIALKS